MPIDAHDNPELSGIPQRGEQGSLAAGSSNSNSHNAGAGGELEVGSIREVLEQLSRLLPRLEKVAGGGGT